MAVLGDTCQCVVIDGSSWLYMAIHGNTWQYIVIHGNTCTKLGPVLLRAQNWVLCCLPLWSTTLFKVEAPALNSWMI